MSVPDLVQLRDGSEVPRLWYGTAWKEAATAGHVGDALTAGFRAIDTANQRKHYHEAGVGRALGAALTGGLARAAVVVQSKFTYARGQDHRLPYDPAAPIATQVAQSFASSLEHLGLDRLDSLVLHGPAQSHGLVADDHEAWRAMEAIAARGQVRWLGISNVAVDQLDALIEFARTPPMFVQNRCYAERGWDRAIRARCAAHQIAYQGFSLLTANRAVVADPRTAAVAARHRVTPAQVVLRFALDLGMIALTGTRDPQHMRDDLAIAELALTEDDRARLETIAPS
jgi:diketogulonate reductase-like aldo/keto reductase